MSLETPSVWYNEAITKMECVNFIQPTIHQQIRIVCGHDIFFMYIYV